MATWSMRYSSFCRSCASVIGATISIKACCIHRIWRSSNAKCVRKIKLLRSLCFLINKDNQGQPQTWICPGLSRKLVKRCSFIIPTGENVQFLLYYRSLSISLPFCLLFCRCFRFPCCQGNVRFKLVELNQVDR